MKKIFLAILISLLIGDTCFAKNIISREGDWYVVTIDKNAQVEGVGQILVNAKECSPPKNKVSADIVKYKKTESAEVKGYYARQDSFQVEARLTYEGIKDGNISVYSYDTEFYIDVPIGGVFSKYGILNVMGARIKLKVIPPDKIIAEPLQ